MERTSCPQDFSLHQVSRCGRRVHSRWQQLCPGIREALVYWAYAQVSIFLFCRREKDGLDIHDLVNVYLFPLLHFDHLFVDCSTRNKPNQGSLADLAKAKNSGKGLAFGRPIPPRLTDNNLLCHGQVESNWIGVVSMTPHAVVCKSLPPPALVETMSIRVLLSSWNSPRTLSLTAWLMPPWNWTFSKTPSRESMRHTWRHFHLSIEQTLEMMSILWGRKSRSTMKWIRLKVDTYIDLNWVKIIILTPGSSLIQFIWKVE
jgi:hypothetical protein